MPLLGPLQVQRETATPTHTGLSLPNKGSKFSREPLWALPGLRSLAGVGGQPWFRLWAGGGSGECAQTPYTGKDQQGRAPKPATTLSPQKEERETLRPVVASATEPGTWLFPTGRTAASAVGASVGWRRLAPRKAEASKQSGNGGNWSIETLLRFLLFGEAGVDALAQTRRVHFVTLITRRKQ